MRQAVSHGAGRSANIQKRDHALHPVVAGFVEEIADGDRTYAFTRKICRQPRCRASEDANHRVQFSSAILQIGAGNSEISATECCGCREQDDILAIPELMLVSGFWRGADDGRDRLYRCGNRRIWQRILPEKHGTDAANDNCQRTELGQFAESHKVHANLGHLGEGQSCNHELYIRNATNFPESAT